MSDESARDAAFSIAEKLSLPVKARTLTVAEMRRNERRLVYGLVGFYAGFVAYCLIGMALEGGEANRDLFWSILPIFILGGIAMALMARWRLRKHAGYRDHLIAVEVTGRNVRIDWNGQSYALDYEDIRYQLCWQSVKGVVYFLGINLESPIGPIGLADQWYSGGGKAAAAIVTEHHKWHHLRRLA